MSIDALIARMEALLGPMQAAGDPRRFFHATYLRTTRAVRDALRAGRFGDPDWVERWDVAFADLYLDALRADSAGGPVPGPWAIAFRTGRERPDAPALRHVLLGMNAHINYDLPQALLAVISGPEFGDPALLGRRRADHQRIDEVLSQRVGAEDAELASTAPRSAVDATLAPLNQAASRRFLREARAKVWDNTIELNAARSLGAAAYAERLGDLEALSAARVAELVRPGQVLLRLAVHGFGVRLVSRGSPIPGGRIVGSTIRGSMALGGTVLGSTVLGSFSPGPHWHGQYGPGPLARGARAAGCARPEAGRAAVVRPGPGGRPGVPGLGGVLPPGLGRGAACVSEPGPGRLRYELAAHRARRLAGAAGHPAVGAQGQRSGRRTALHAAVLRPGPVGLRPAR